MLKKVAIAVCLFTPLSLFASSEAHLDRAPIKLNDDASLQRGAATFVNYCMGCHGATFLRYNKLQEIGISEAVTKANLMFNADKIGEQMVTSMPPRSGRAWFGVTPPDLTLAARSRGADWLYTYLRGFYRDASRPNGWNNTVFPNVGMPHALYQAQGPRELTIIEERHTTDEKTHAVTGAEKVTTVYDENGEKKVTTEKLEHLLGHGSIVQHFSSKGSPQTALAYDQMSADVVNFLTWAGEPEQNKRFSTGVWTMVYLGILMALAIPLKRAFWKDIH